VHVSLLFTAYASSYTHMHIHVITYIALIFWIKLKLKMPNFLTAGSQRPEYPQLFGYSQHAARRILFLPYLAQFFHRFK
jgi:hypothetical protein